MLNVQRVHWRGRLKGPGACIGGDRRKSAACRRTAATVVVRPIGLSNRPVRIRQPDLPRVADRRRVWRALLVTPPFP